MGRTSLAAQLATLAGATAAIALLHHGHIAMFLAAIHDEVGRRLPSRFSKAQVRVEPSLLQVHFGDPLVHYEVWVQRKTRSIEIGLHFEGDRDSNRRWAELLAAQGPELQRQLGPGAELEDWTRKWTRLHETRPVPGDDWRPKRDLTSELAQDVAQRLVRYIQVLQPILDAVPAAAGVPRKRGGSRK
jgi:hypothetical protein